jgi:hypothetical protein
MEQHGTPKINEAGVTKPQEKLIMLTINIIRVIVHVSQFPVCLQSQSPHLGCDFHTLIVGMKENPCAVFHITHHSVMCNSYINTLSLQINKLDSTSVSSFVLFPGCKTTNVRNLILHARQIQFK